MSRPIPAVERAVADGFAQMDGRDVFAAVEVGLSCFSGKWNRRPTGRILSWGPAEMPDSFAFLG